MGVSAPYYIARWGPIQRLYIIKEWKSAVYTYSDEVPRP